MKQSWVQQHARDPCMFSQVHDLRESLGGLGFRVASPCSLVSFNVLFYCCRMSSSSVIVAATSCIVSSLSQFHTKAGSVCLAVCVCHLGYHHCGHRQQRYQSHRRHRHFVRHHSHVMANIVPSAVTLTIAVTKHQASAPLSPPATLPPSQ